jgi:hypothetical protein
MGPGETLVIIIGALLAEMVVVYVLAVLLTKVILYTPASLSFILRAFGVGEPESPQVFLELRFPADTTKSAFATEQLHILLRTLVGYRGLWNRLVARKKPYSLELVGTNNEGIRYVLMVPEEAVEFVSRNLLSYLPGIKVKRVEDYMSALSKTAIGVLELRLAQDFVLPLQDHKALAEHDPIAYLTGQMTKLAPDELASLQVVAVPVFGMTHHRVTRHTAKLRETIALNKAASDQLIRQRTPVGWAWWCVWYPPLWFVAAMVRLVAGVGEILYSMFSQDHDLPDYMKTRVDTHSPTNPYEEELGKMIKSKLDQPLFEVTIRLLVASPDRDVINDRIRGLFGAFEPFRSSYQRFGIRQDVPLLAPGNRHLTDFKARRLSTHHFSQQTILSSSELSDLYHFPNTDLTKTEGLVKSRTQELPAPLSIKHTEAKLDVIVGVNKHGGEEQPIGLTVAQRQKHTYVIGKTGTGKTTLLASSIYQDMVNGKGLAVLDPHGDMFRELLEVVPEHRKQDVIVFDPSDREYPLGLNLLDPGVEFTDEDDRRDWITSIVLSVFERLADEKQWGPRMEHILRNATLTALHLPKPSLYTIQRLLTDKKYQQEVAGTLKDPVLRQFWEKEFKLMGSMQLSNATAPLTHRLGHFITTKMSRHILLQEKSTLRVAEIMNEGKILLVNLSKGDIGKDQSYFFGTILTSLVWMAAYQRTKIPEKERRDFFLYVDEFQNFATRQFTDITSEGRKFHVSVIASHQNIAQVEDKAILKIVAGNSHTIICLKASPEDEGFILPYMEPAVQKGDIVNLSPYNFFMKTTADESEDAFSGQTVPLRAKRSAETRDYVMELSRKQYGKAKAEVEKDMKKLFQVYQSTTIQSPAKREPEGEKTREVHGA